MVLSRCAALLIGAPNESMREDALTFSLGVAVEMSKRRCSEDIVEHKSIILAIEFSSLGHLNLVACTGFAEIFRATEAFTNLTN